MKKSSAGTETNVEVHTNVSLITGECGMFVDTDEAKCTAEGHDIVLHPQCHGADNEDSYSEY